MAVRISGNEAATLSWGLVLALVLSAVFIAAGLPMGPILVLGYFAILIFSFRFVYLTFYLAIACMPLLGIMVSVPTGTLSVGERAFGGSIDVSLGEVVFFLALSSWALKLIFLWRRRRDENWRPKLPAIKTYLALFAAHLASAFSPLVFDRLPVFKFALRPVLFDYLAFIALPVNLLRSRRRFIAALSVFAGIGLVAAFNGFVSIFFPADSGQLVGRAYPLPIFGLHALGENQNELADFMVTVVPFTLALALLTKDDRIRRLIYLAAGFEFVIGLLTFTRTAWIVFAVQAVFLAATHWRQVVVKNMAVVSLVLLMLLPLGVAMAVYSVSETARSSNSTRLALSEIAYEIFTSSPWLGGGAGTFVDRVGSSQVFVLEYGSPLDSHGFLQKLAAETGIIGPVAFALVLLQLAFVFRRSLVHVRDPVVSGALLLLMAGVGGEFIYQLFNTDYWTGKMWLPVGLALAAIGALKETGTAKSPSADTLAERAFAGGPDA